MKRAELRFFRLIYAMWLFGVFVFFSPPATWNPVSRFDLTRAIVERQTLSIDAYASSTGDRALVHGTWYTDKAPLPSLLALPTYVAVRTVQSIRGSTPEYRAFAVGSTPAVRMEPNRAFQRALHACSLFTTGIAGVALGLLAFELLRRRTTTRAAFAASAITVLGSPLLPYSTSFYGHAIAGAGLLGALVAFDTRGRRLPDGPSPAALRAAGACLVLAMGSEYISAFPAALIGLAFMTGVPQRRWLAVIGNVALGALPLALIVGWYHTTAFGAPWRTGYSFIARPEFAAGHAHGLLGINLPTSAGLWGLTFGTRRGLFYVTPVLLLGMLFGARRAFRTRDLTWASGLAAFAVLLCANAGYYMWWGGAAAGPRHLLPCIAFLGFGLAFVPRTRTIWRIALYVLAALSLFNAVALTSIGIEAPEGGDILRDFAWPGMLAGRIVTSNGATNLGMALGFSRPFSILPLLLWLGAGYWYLSTHLRTRPVAFRSSRHAGRAVGDARR